MDCRVLHWFSILTLALLPGFFVGCGASADGPSVPDASINSSTVGDSNDSSNQGSSGPVTLRAKNLSTSSPAQTHVEVTPEAVIKTSLGDITIQLDDKNSPRTVDHFLDNYVSSEFYDGTIFHYVDAENANIIIGGGYTPDDQLKPSRGEVLNEADNGLSNKRGTIAMSRYPEARDSATCQFFINLKDNLNFDHTDEEDDTKFGYCVFGHVIKGMEVVDRIAQAEVSDSKPVTPIIIESIRRTK